MKQDNVIEFSRPEQVTRWLERAARGSAAIDRAGGGGGDAREYLNATGPSSARDVRTAAPASSDGLHLSHCAGASVHPIARRG